MVWMGPVNEEEASWWAREQVIDSWNCAENKGRLLQTLGWQTGVFGSLLLMSNLLVLHAAWLPTGITAVIMLVVGVVMHLVGDVTRPDVPADEIAQITWDQDGRYVEVLNGATDVPRCITCERGRVDQDRHRNPGYKITCMTCDNEGSVNGRACTRCQKSAMAWPGL